MRGGKRDGAGRKPSESTVRVSVPVGALSQVKDVIESYKQAQLKDDQIIKDMISLKKIQPIKDSALDSDKKQPEAYDRQA